MKLKPFPEHFSILWSLFEYLNSHLIKKRLYIEQISLHWRVNLLTQSTSWTLTHASSGWREPRRRTTFLSLVLTGGCNFRPFRIHFHRANLRLGEFPCPVISLFKHKFKKGHNSLQVLKCEYYMQQKKCIPVYGM